MTPESTPPDPMPGAGPWQSDGGPVGVLVVHGFTGNPQSVRPLAEAFAAAGSTVSLPLLPGHGTRVEDMLPTRWQDWSGAVEQAYDELAARRRRPLGALRRRLRARGDDNGLVTKD